MLLAFMKDPTASKTIGCPAFTTDNTTAGPMTQATGQSPIAVTLGLQTFFGRRALDMPSRCLIRSNRWETAVASHQWRCPVKITYLQANTPSTPADRRRTTMRARPGGGKIIRYS